MQIIHALWLLVITLSLSVASSQASPIFYDEAVNGDLVGLTTFVLDTGTNVVTGTTDAVDAGAPDFDDFAFVVPVGMRLVSLTLSATVSPPSDPGAAHWTLRSGGTNLDFLHIPDDSLSAEFLPLATGSYILGESIKVGLLIKYTFSLAVESTQAVPEPPVLWLLASALIAVGARRWTGRRDIG